MCLSKHLILPCILGCAFVAAAWAGQQEAKTYTDQHVQFSYPNNRYNAVSTGGTLQDDFYAYFLRLKKEDAADLVTICMKAIKDCGTDMGMVQPYWYSEDGALQLFSATTEVKARRMVSGEMVFEAFPACPAKDREGFSAYAGDCYVLVRAEKDRTLSITYWIGPTSLHRSKVQAVREATDILKSIKIK